MTNLHNKEEIFEIINNKENPMHFMVRMLERAAIEEALYITRGNQTNAAILLGMGRITLLLIISKISSLLNRLVIGWLLCFDHGFICKIKRSTTCLATFIEMT